MKSALNRWIPAMIVMVVIYALSATPSHRLPDAGVLDLLFKKGGHFIGYGLLALAAVRGFGGSRNLDMAAALFLTFLYAVSDELHQSFVPGRGPSAVDVLIDMIGAISFVYWLYASPRLQKLIFLGTPGK